MCGCGGVLPPFLFWDVLVGLFFFLFLLLGLFFVGVCLCFGVCSGAVLVLFCLRGSWCWFLVCLEVV